VVETTPPVLHPEHDAQHGSFDNRKENAMFWVFALVVVIALVFAQLGAYSVWFGILKTGLQLALIVIAGLTIVLLWKRIFGSKGEK
jgi:hypothetical protein